MATPLGEAVRAGDVDAVTALLSAPGAHVRALLTTKYKNDPLLFALIRNAPRGNDPGDNTTKEVRGG